MRRYTVLVGVGCLMIGLLASAFTPQLTAQTPPAPEDDDTGTGISLAHQAEGTFIGGFIRTPADPNGVLLTNYEIVLTRINDTSVSVAPASGSGSATFVANLQSAVNGSIAYIKLTVSPDLVHEIGQFVVVNGVGEMGYTYHLGGDPKNRETFGGKRPSETGD